MCFKAIMIYQSNRDLYIYIQMYIYIEMMVDNPNNRIMLPSLYQLVFFICRSSIFCIVYMFVDIFTPFDLIFTLEKYFVFRGMQAIVLFINICLQRRHLYITKINSSIFIKQIFSLNHHNYLQLFYTECYKNVMHVIS